ncbi:type II secretion system protein GspM [Marinobacter subterrani]|uniref:Type II secretion system (T2SS), protein M n=1 Tax=Marinobacter subterrani TaxID=1658765 RepID=A0A0J7J6F6_9GAMM|nr:type II secretion system protein GspM [Marinobacter subterrani]KMQ73531.1 Type II secretion system (T2SS), protein M [Marinobacter subterrani]
MAGSPGNSFARAADWYNQRPIRERGLILLTALVLSIFVGWDLVVAPLQQEQQSLESRMQTLVVSRDNLMAQQQALNEQLTTDPSRVLREQLNARQQRLDRLNQQIAETTGKLVAPRAMVALLRNMLAAQDSLVLQGMELKTPTPVFAPETGSALPQGKQEPQEAPEPLLYAHDVEMRIAGGYLEVLNYLEKLEALDQRLGWMMLEYRAGDWPSGEAVIRVRTLSLDQAWLGV